MSDISVKLYEECQASAIKKFPPYLVREFLPLTFHDVQFQTNIQALDELWKFADSQQEFRFEENIKLLNGGFTLQEFDIFKSATRKIVDYTSSFNKPVFGRNALTRSFLSLRALDGLAKSMGKEIKDLRVLEVGPGSGYLGLILGLINKESKYWGLEVTQSLYLYQNQIWHHSFGNRVFEYFNKSNMPTQAGGEFVHIPWWTWADYLSYFPNFDVLVINHAVNEISPKGFMYLMAKLSQNLGNIKVVVEGWGGGNYHSNLETLLQNGFNLCHNFHDHRQDSKYLPVSVGEFKKIKKNQVRLTSKILKCFSKRLTDYFEKRSIQKRFYYSPKIGKLSQFLINSKPDEKIDSILSYYESFENKVSMWTEDEIFGNYIGSNKHLIKK